MNAPEKFYGKFRGKVLDNQDPMKRGRLKIKAPDILGDQESGWATPCVPYAGKNVGLFLIPPVDALVWLEFEQGDLDCPIWSGCFWGENQVPESQGEPDVKVLKTGIGTITINDKQGSAGITIETSSGLKLVMDDQGIELSNSSQKIKLSSANVSVNDGALEVM
jgi:uncharacterized protein involved in type VI secretion and phage assembly